MEATTVRTGIAAFFILLGFIPQVFAKQTTLVALFGDSITVGYNVANGCTIIPGNGVDSSSNNCPRFDLNAHFNAPPKRTVTLSNWGIGGSTTMTGVGRIDNNLIANSGMYGDQGCRLDGSADNCYVLILYGTNDLSINVSSSTIGFNIGVMIDEARRLQYEPIIGTLTPRTGKSVLAANAEITQVAANKNAFLVDLYTRFISEPGGYQNLMEFDGGGYLHPNEAGYLVIAEEWFKKRLAGVIKPDQVIIAPIIYLLLGD